MTAEEINSIKYRVCCPMCDNDSDYCPDCGVKMFEPQESEDKE